MGMKFSTNFPTFSHSDKIGHYRFVTLKMRILSKDTTCLCMGKRPGGGRETKNHLEKKDM
jgi:hypothetical protein